MELDREKQRRVWDRVRGDGEQMPQLRRMGLGELMWILRENAGAYRTLAKRFPGREGEILQRLHQECRQNIICLRGLCALTGEDRKGLPGEPPKESLRRSLEKCYFREKHLCEEFSARAADPEYGIVMARLARQTGDRCVAVLEILGESGTQHK